MVFKFGWKFIDKFLGTGAGDILLAHDGADTLTGLTGNDILSGGRGKDQIDGGDGNDKLFGGADSDTIVGGKGDDVIFNGSSLALFSQDDAYAMEDNSADNLSAGAGNDRVYIGHNDKADGGAGGYDTLVSSIYLHSFKVLNLDFSKIGGAAPVAIGWDTTRAFQFERVDIDVNGVYAGSKVIGTSGDDRIIGAGVSERQTGPSTYISGIALYGGAGDDVIVGSYNKNDKIDGGSGDDEIDSSRGIDTVKGGSGADIFIVTKAPSDYYNVGGTTPDVITDFDAKQDLLLFQFGYILPTMLPTDKVTLVANKNPVVSSAKGGQFLYDTDSGKLSFDMNGKVTGGLYDLATLTTKPVLTAANLVADGFLTIPALEGKTASDKSNAVLRAGSGGNDVMNGTAATDKFFGNIGNDTIKGLAGDDLLFGGAGNDVLDGGDGNDRLIGGYGADKILGGAGNDFIRAGAANVGNIESYFDLSKDIVDAGAGNDRVIIETGDTALGGSGTDTLVIESRLSDKGQAPLLKLNFANIGESKAFGFGLGTTTAGQFENVDIYLDGLASGSQIGGTSGDDRLMFNISPVTSGPLIGSGSGGAISGRDGNDYISGSSYSDKLSGGDGDDVIRNFGGDIITLGTGADKVFTQQLAGAMTIRDFTGSDMIIFEYQANSGQTITFDDIKLVVGSAKHGTHAGLAQFLYNPATGSLMLDTNGSTQGGEVSIALLEDAPALSANQLGFEFYY